MNCLYQHFEARGYSEKRDKGKFCSDHHLNVSAIRRVPCSNTLGRQENGKAAGPVFRHSSLHGQALAQHCPSYSVSLRLDLPHNSPFSIQFLKQANIPKNTEFCSVDSHKLLPKFKAMNFIIGDEEIQKVQSSPSTTFYRRREYKCVNTVSYARKCTVSQVRHRYY